MPARIRSRLTLAAALATALAFASPAIAQDAQVQAQTAEQIRQQLGAHYDVKIDEPRRLIQAVGVNRLSAADAAWDIEAVSTWWQSLTGLDTSYGSRYAGAPEWVGVLIVPANEFAKFGGPAARSRGQFHAVGGLFDRDRNRLISTRLGPNLRHELVHVMHERSMRKLNQRHATWIQEGLATLAEDLDPSGSGFAPSQSWRLNVAHRLARGNQLLPLTELAAMDNQRFTAQRPLARYAQALAVVYYLHVRGDLPAFWNALLDGAKPGRTENGLAAITEATGMDIESFDKALRAWLLGVRLMPEEVTPGMASLGFRAANNAHGIEVLGMEAGVVSPIRTGDTLLAIDGRPVRELPELIRLLSTRAPGDRVSLTLRRGTIDREESMELLER